MKTESRGGKREGAGRPRKPYRSQYVYVPEPCLELVKRVIAEFHRQHGDNKA